MVPAPATRVHTLDDYFNAPEGKHYHLLHGELIDMGTPVFSHQQIVVSLVTAIKIWLNSLGKGTVCVAPFSVILGENAVEPDIMIVLDEKSEKITEKAIWGAPDMVIEILSPSTGYYDLTVKKDLYEAHGVQEYFIVDVPSKKVMAHQLSLGKYKLAYEEPGVIRSNLLGTEIRF